MGEKTEDATPKRRQKAREQGNVARSSEFTGAMVTLCAGAAVALSMNTIVGRASGLIADSIRLIAARDPAGIALGPFMIAALVDMAWMIAPVLGVGFVGALFFNYVQIGAIFTVDPLVPSADKLDAVAGLKGLFEPKKGVELAKNVAKLAVAGAVGYAVIHDKLAMLVELARMSLGKAIEALGAAIVELGMFLGGTLVVFGVVDLVWQRHAHQKSLRMSKDDVKREHKESEGDPEVKGKRKRLHKEVIKDAGISNVKEADAVVVNPTHVAAALAYDDAQKGAPQVVAAGRGKLAGRIKKAARRHNVPMVRNVYLARALVDVDIDHEIPADFYEPVAQILTYVYRLRQETS